LAFVLVEVIGGQSVPKSQIGQQQWFGFGRLVATAYGSRTFDLPDTLPADDTSSGEMQMSACVIFDVEIRDQCSSVRLVSVEGLE
jgi:hypothetical protein